MASAAEHSATLKLVTKLARESGSITATTRTEGYAGGQDVSKLVCCIMCVLTLDLCYELIDVVEVQCLSAIVDLELSIRRLCRAITVGKIVHHDLYELRRAGALGLRLCGREVRPQTRDFCDLVEPDEVRDLGNLKGLGRKRGVGDGGRGSLDLGDVGRAQEDLTVSVGDQSRCYKAPV